MIPNQVGRPCERVNVEVRIPSRGLRLRVAKQLPYDRQAQARAGADRCERVPQIVNAKAGHP